MDSLKNILSVNIGSDSVKMSLFDINEMLLWSAHFQKLSSNSPVLIIGDDKFYFSSHLTITEAISKTAEHIPTKEIHVVGHRFVHGGSLQESVLVDEKVIELLKQCIQFAPLHLPYSLEGVEVSRALFPKAQHIAVFDTAFHSNMPKKAYKYAIPQYLAKKYNIRRYGFHGISHAFLWDTYVKHTGNSKGKIITLHLGNGCSMAAISAGKSIDTSMGFTPLEGLIMATRGGDIDIGAAMFLQDAEGLSPKNMSDILNNKSGLLGISNISSQMSDLLQSDAPQAKEAIELFCYRIQKYLGAYISILEGVDAIVFSGGIGENAPFIRKSISKTLHWCGTEIDNNINNNIKNMSSGTIHRISEQFSKIDVFVVATDENKYIAREAALIAKL